MEKINTINYLPEEKAVTYRNDFMNYHNDWRTKESFDFLFEEDDKSIDQSFGYIPVESDSSYDNWWYAIKYDDKSSDVELDELDLESLNNILNLCRENNIELLMYFTPIDMLDELNQKYRYKVWEYCEENNVKFVDFVDLSEELDYRIPVHNDGFHSKVTGANVTTSYLANFIKENNYEFNHKEDENLNRLYEYYVDLYDYFLFYGEHNPVKYLDRVVNYPYLKIIRYKGTRLNGSLREAFVKMNLNDMSEGTNYYAVINNGVVIASGQDDIGLDVDGHYIEVNSSGIYMDGNLVLDGNDLGFAIFDKKYEHVSVKKISYINNKLWDSDYNFDYNHK